MDNRSNKQGSNAPMHDLFSRGSTPPVQQPQPQYVPQPHLPHNMSSSQIDSLFQHLNTSSSTLDQSQQSSSSFVGQQDSYGSGSNPTTPMMGDEVPSSNTTTASTNTQSLAERQNALLSLLAGPPSNAATRSINQQQPAPQTQQIPTPPGSSSQRSNASPASNAEVQGKLLLEQLMSGCVFVTRCIAFSAPFTHWNTRHYCRLQTRGGGVCELILIIVRVRTPNLFISSFPFLFTDNVSLLLQ